MPNSTSRKSNYLRRVEDKRRRLSAQINVSLTSAKTLVLLQQVFFTRELLAYIYIHIYIYIDVFRIGQGIISTTTGRI